MENENKIEQKVSAQETAKAQAKKSFSKSVLKKEFVLNHEKTQDLVDRFYRRLSVALYNVNVIMQILVEKDSNNADTESMVEEIENFISGSLNDLNNNLDLRLKEVSEIYNEAGVPINEWKEGIKATAPCKYNISVASPDAVRFLDIVEKLDQYLSILDYIWLKGFMPSNRKHTKLVHNSIVEMHRFSSKAINMEMATFKYIYNNNKNEAVKEEVDKIKNNSEEKNENDAEFTPEDVKFI